MKLLYSQLKLSLASIILFLCFMASTNTTAQVQGALSCQCPPGSEIQGQTYTYNLGLTGSPSSINWFFPFPGYSIVSSNLSSITVKWTTPGNKYIIAYVSDSYNYVTEISLEVSVKTVWYHDNDGDGFGDPNDSVTQNTRPANYVSNNTDCNDNDDDINPNTIWYLNKDRDGFARSTTKSCTRPNTNYTTTEYPLGDCNDNDAKIHPNTVWYRDTDNDGFRDPGGTTQKKCNKPSGNWLRSDLNKGNDSCPSQPASSGSTNGCDADCASGVVSIDGSFGDPQTPENIVAFNLPEKGGNTKAKITFNGSCSNPYEIKLTPVNGTTMPSGFTVTQNSNIPNQIDISATEISTAGSYRNVELQLEITGGQILNKRLYIYQQGPPLPCTISGFNTTGDYSGAAQTLNFDISFSNCSPQALTFIEQTQTGTVVNAPWIRAYHPSNNTGKIKVVLEANNTGVSRSVVIVGTRSGGAAIRAEIIQNCSSKTWYRDTDNDGFRDLNGAVRNSCLKPTDGNWVQSTVNKGNDECPTENSAENVLYTWYADTDNDGFRDPSGASREGCNKPSGNWVRSDLNKGNDSCPSQPASSGSTNGCDADCASGVVSIDGSFGDPQTPENIVAFNLPEKGGNTKAKITFNGSCSNPYEIKLTPVNGTTMPSGFTVTQNSNIPNQIDISATEISTAGSYRNVELQLEITGGQILNKRLYIYQQGPPLPCTISGFNTTGDYSGAAQTSDFNISFANCSAQALTFIEQTQTGTVVNASWIRAYHPSNNTGKITVALEANNTGASRSVIIVGTRSGGAAISAKITQNCNSKTWYRDTDNDDFRDLNGAVRNSCLEPTDGNWVQSTVNKGNDVCPTEYSTENVLYTWYADTDNDGFRDPSGASQMGCNKPSGNWVKSTDNKGNDACPNQSGNSSSTDGCPPPCTFNLTSDSFDSDAIAAGAYYYIGFNVNGGSSAYINAVFDLASCSGTTINVVKKDANDDWFTINTSTSNPFTIQVRSNNGDLRSAEIEVYANNDPTTIKTFYIEQEGKIVTTPPISTCAATVRVDNTNDLPTNTSVSSEIDFGIASETKNIQVLFTPSSCTQNVTFVDIYTSQPLDLDWLNIGIVSNNNYNFTTTDNNDGINRNAFVGVMNADGNIVAAFILNQDSCNAKEWYPDTDGDNLGDATATPRYACNAPTDQEYNYVANAKDLCPDTPGSMENNGCPPGDIVENRNTITNWTYDVNGDIKASSKTYFNELGKLEQTQAWNVKSDSIWASAVLYDEFDRPALQTLSAPLRKGLVFQFKEKFIERTDNATEYSLSDYDGDNIEAPNAVGNNNHGTLGWYYSENNTREPYQDITAYPFTKSVYSNLNPGQILRNLGGNKIDNQWPQTYSFSMKASDELALATAFGLEKYKTIETTKTISRDAHGIENVVFIDTDGKVLAAARSGSKGNESVPMSVAIPEQGFVDIHIAEGITGFTVSNANAVSVYNLITEKIATTNTGNLGNGFYRISVNNLATYIPNSINITYTVNYYDYSLNEYDKANRLLAEYQHIGDTRDVKLKSTYEYNTVGQLLKATSPDEGEAQFKYRESGQIRFSQNTKQRDPNEDGDNSDAEFSYTNYDSYGRLVESGIYTNGPVTFENSDSILENIVTDINVDNDGLANNFCKEQTFIFYDEPDTINLHAALTAEGIATTAYIQQKYVASNISKTYTVGELATATWYSYDVYGRIAWIVQDIEGLGVKTLDYSYDEITGEVIRIDFQKEKPTEHFIHRYVHNTANQLIKIETSTTNSENSFITHAEYTYYETGALKRAELADGIQGIDYVYNLAGQLKSINHPSLGDATKDPGKDTNDLFGMQIDYHTNDYARSLSNVEAPNYGTDRLDGNIKGIRWKNNAVAGATGELQYAYEYNRNNWLTAADFSGTGTNGSELEQNPVLVNITVESGDSFVKKGTESVTLSATGSGVHFKQGSTASIRITNAAEGATTLMDGDYDVSNITYDANGNIQSLTRNKNSAGGSAAMDELTYNYKADKPNQLSQVIDSVGDVDGADDIGSQAADNYVYNSIGQLIQDWEKVSEEDKQAYITSGIIPKTLVSYSYTTTGLVKKVTQGVNEQEVIFYYNDKNFRVKKEVYVGGELNSTNHYVRDASGTVMAIYQNGTLIENIVHGIGRLGVYNRLDNSTSYELTDHLGNVRAVFKSQSASVVAATDYYPFGMAMPARNTLGAYRYAFQGQEKDSETGKEAFQLRLWDARIGRWLTTDPVGQYASPYLGMGNNPIIRIDPDGGQDCQCNDNDPPFDMGAFFRSMFHSIYTGFADSNDIEAVANHDVKLANQISEQNKKTSIERNKIAESVKDGLEAGDLLGFATLLSGLSDGDFDSSDAINVIAVTPVGKAGKIIKVAKHSEKFVYIYKGRKVIDETTKKTGIYFGQTINNLKRYSEKVRIKMKYKDIIKVPARIADAVEQQLISIHGTTKYGNGMASNKRLQMSLKRQIENKDLMQEAKEFLDKNVEKWMEMK